MFKMYSCNVLFCKIVSNKRYLKYICKECLDNELQTNLLIIIIKNKG